MERVDTSCEVIDDSADILIHAVLVPEFRGIGHYGYYPLRCLLEYRYVYLGPQPFLWSNWLPVPVDSYSDWKVISP
jgi:hypothetical protein